MDENVTSNILRSRDRFGLSSFYFLQFAALGFVTAFLPLFLLDRGLSLKQIGALSAIYAFAGASAQVPVGALSDRLGHRKPLAISSAVLVGLIYLFFDRIETFGGFCVLYLIGGVLFHTVATLTSALISDWTAGGRSTGRSYGITRIWGSIGWITTLGLVSIFPFIIRGQNLLPTVFVLFLVAGVSLALVGESPMHRQERRPVLKSIPRLLSNRNLTMFLVSFFLYRLCESASMSFLSIYIQQLGGTRSLIAMAFAFSAIIEMPFMLWVGGASDRIGRRPPLVIAFLLMPLRLFIYTQLASSGQIFYAQALHGVTFSFMLVASLAFVADLSPGELRATGQGLLGMTAGLAMAIGPLIGGILADTISIAGMYFMLMGVAGLAGLLFILLVHESHPDISADRLSDRLQYRHKFLRPAISLLSKPLLRR